MRRLSVGIIGPACPILLGCTPAIARIILIDDRSEPGAKDAPHTNPMRPIRAPLGANTVACSNYPSIPSNRHERQNQQPFYRGLKKYRKP